jgi:sarcosine oxidase subunit alpha
MDVRPQNVWPSLAFDLKQANQLVGRFLTAGFYYKTFIKPQRLWPAYQVVLSRFAAGGVAGKDSVHGYYDKRYATSTSWWPAAGRRACRSRRRGRRRGRVLLVEEEYELGGHLRFSGEQACPPCPSCAHRWRARPSIEVMTTRSSPAGTTTTGSPSCSARSAGRGAPGEGRAGALVAAAGLIERPVRLRRQRPAGGDAVDRGATPGQPVRREAGRPAVVLSANEEGTPPPPTWRASGSRSCGARRPQGRDAPPGDRQGRVQAVELEDGTVLAADLLVTATGWTAPTSLLNMAGDRPVWSPTAARFVPSGALPPTVLATGGLVGDGTPDELAEHGRATGALAARRARGGTGSDVPVLPVADHPAMFRSSTHGFVDFSEDVSSKDIVAAAKEGYDSSELVKRFTTATMGPSQGKLEVINTVAVLGEATGRQVADLGTTVWRPPYAPISLGALAGGSSSRPGCPRCSRGTRATGRRRCSRASGSGRTTTATRSPRRATSARTSGSSTSHPSASWSCRDRTSRSC